MTSKATRPLALRKATAFLSSWLSYRTRHSADVVGVSVAVMVENEIIFAEAYGVASSEKKQALTTEHLFNMASQTKMVTTIIIMKLCEDGKLALDEPAHRYLPWLRTHKDGRVKQITIRHLLSHSSGLLRDGNDADHWSFKKPAPSKRKLREIVLGDNLVFLPGSSVKYSNIGYGLLGSIIEVVSGKSFTVMVSNLNKRLQIGAHADYSNSLREELATGYGLPFDHHRKPFLKRRPARSLSAATGIYATPEHMCQLACVLFDDKHNLLSAGSKQEIRKTQSRMKHGYDDGTEFGLGLEFQDLNGRRIFGHTGHVAGHVSATFAAPWRGIIVSVATNAKDSSAATIARGVLGAVDYFIDTIIGQDANYSERFAARLVGGLSTVQVIESSKKIIIVDPDDWEPFSWYETLAIVNERTLRFITEGSVYNKGEVLEYWFSAKKIKRVRLAGATLLPDEGDK